MVRYVREDREYSKAIRESIVQNDVYSFVDMRYTVQRVRLMYTKLYQFVFQNWASCFGRPVVAAQYNMHG